MGDAPVDVQERIDKLGPVLDKLRSLDPKSFNLLGGLLNQAESPQAPRTSFLQLMRDDPVDTQLKLEKLGPIMEKLRGLDPRHSVPLPALSAKSSLLQRRLLFCSVTHQLTRKTLILTLNGKSRLLDR